MCVSEKCICRWPLSFSLRSNSFIRHPLLLFFVSHVCSHSWRPLQFLSFLIIKDPLLLHRSDHSCLSTFFLTFARPSNWPPTPLTHFSNFLPLNFATPLWTTTSFFLFFRLSRKHLFDMVLETIYVTRHGVSPLIFHPFLLPILPWSLRRLSARCATGFLPAHLCSREHNEELLHTSMFE